jgi:GcrA cell cycle regulator
MGGTFEWTQQRVQDLREAWAAGLTASVIAHAFGIGRGSVIGKAHRLGLSRRPRRKLWREVERFRPAEATTPVPACTGTVSLARGPAKPLLRSAYRPARRQHRAPNSNSPATPLMRSSRRMPPVAADAAGASKPGRAVPAVAGTAPRPSAPGCSILDLTNASCRWPLEPAGLADPRYCGEPSADLSARTPYCAAHMRAAYIFAPRPHAKRRAP